MDPKHSESPYSFHLVFSCLHLTMQIEKSWNFHKFGPGGMIWAKQLI
jgi:hypothetical protein